MGNMFENVQLIVTTRGRVDFQPTLDNLVDKIRKEIIIVCFPGEKQYHELKWGNKVKGIIEHPVNLTNIDAIRYWCINYFEKDYIIFMDDNLNFHVRKNSDKGHQCKFPLHQICDKHFDEKTIEEIILQMFDWIINNLKSNKYGIVGFNQRSGNNRVEEDEVENTRTYAFWGISKIKFKKVEYEYDVTPFKYKGDFYTFIFMLTHGFSNLVSYKYAFGKVGGANNKGGCSIYRNEDLMSKEAELLVEKFPGLVSIKEKKSKSWKNTKDTIKDVIIYWKKSYEYGLRNRTIS